MRYLVLSSSLAPDSRSRILARQALERLTAMGEEVTWLDAAELELPHCGSDAGWDHADAQRVKAAVHDADAILVALGVYNYSTSAIAKALVEFGGNAFTEKVVGFLCTSGGSSSYMAVMPLANSLMLDFRSFIVPRFVFATGAAFKDGTLIDEEVATRIDGLCRELVRVTRSLRSVESAATPP